jgi:hypothetical protein
MTLEFKKFLDPNEDACLKDFLDILDTDSKVGNDLGIIKVAFARNSVDAIKDNSDVMKDIFGNVESVSKHQIFIVGYDLNVLCFDLICAFKIIKEISVKF